MDRQTREVIEFDKVLDLLAGRASSSLGRQFVLALEPLDDAAAVEERTAALRDLLSHLERNQSPPLGGLFDASELLAAAAIEGGSLDEEQWRETARFLDICNRLAEWRDDALDVGTPLHKLLAPLATDAELQKSIERTFDADGAIRDDATHELSRIRRSLQQAEHALRKTLQRLLSELSQRGVLQEDFSTLRGERHVFPVRASSRSRVAGILHGSSSSGETVYIEPLEVVEAGNDLEALREEELREIHRILRALTARLRPFLPVAEANLDILRRLDGLLALARTSIDKGWHLPILRGGALRLFNAHHPLLNLRGQKSIPLTILLDPEDRCIVLSGPNAGGKTTAMKTIALHVVLARCGCPIPAFPDSSLPVYTQVLADIGDRQDLEEGLSTFTGHIRRIGDLWETTDSRTLVVLDELGTGTDPQEGGALAVSLLEGFHRRAALVITTSHLNPVKIWAEDTPGVRNASFGLDPKTHEPTFTLRLDIPGASEALEIAEREGLDHSLLERAREIAGPRQLEMGEMLRRIEEKERRLESAVRESEARARSLAEQERVARARADLLRGERREVREATLREREKAVSEARERIERLIADLPGEEELRRRKEVLLKAREEAIRQEQLNAAEKRKLANEEMIRGEVTVGAKAFVRSLRQWGEVLDLDTEEGEARLLVGRMELRVPLTDLVDHDPEERRAAEKARTEREEEHASGRKGARTGRKARRELLRADESAGLPMPSRSSTPVNASYTPSRPASMTLDLHGFRVEEATAELDRFLDRAVLADFPYVKICHGTGTGRLYKAVHEYLRKHPVVKRYRFGTPDEGGGGMTIVEF